MRNYMEPPLGYIVLTGTTSKRGSYPSLNDQGRQDAESAASFLGYEQLGYVSAPDLPGAAQTAEVIAYSGSCQCPYVDVNPLLRPRDAVDGELEEQFQSRLQRVLATLGQRYTGLPCVWVCYQSFIDDLCTAISPGKDCSDVRVQPGGIIAIYQEQDGSLCLECRYRSANTEYAGSY